MGLWDKLHLGKKEEEFDFDKLAEQHMGTDEDPVHTPEKSLFPQEDLNLQLPPSPSAQLSSSVSSKDIELINSKLDTIKAMLQSIDQRLSALEKDNKRLW